MSVSNQRCLFIDRRKTGGSIRYMNLDIEGTLNVVNDIKTVGGLKIYLYLCSQVPHSYDNEINVNRANQMPFEFSPVGIKMVYPDIDRKTIQRGFDELVELGIIVQRKNNIYQFKDVPLKYRAQTYEEYTLTNALQDNAKDTVTEILGDQKIRENKQKYEWEE